MLPLASLATRCQSSILCRVMPRANRYIEEGHVYHIMRTKMTESHDGTWSVREPDAPYGLISGTKIERKRGLWGLNWA